MSNWTSEPRTCDRGYACFNYDIKITAECHESEVLMKPEKKSSLG